MSIEDFGRNLRYLCAQHDSISKVCRDIGIQRQQFNKYLTGASRPAQRNLIRICNYFKINESRLLCTHEEFVRNYSQQTDFNIEQQFQSCFPSHSGDLKRYLGYYHCYFYSLAYPGKIILSLVLIYEYKDQVFTKTIEHLHDKPQINPENKFINKYKGIVGYSCNRLFMIDRETMWGKSFSMTILYPTYQSHISYLHGLSIGCPTLGRIPSASRIALSYLGKQTDKREALNMCGLYNKNDPSIPKTVLRLIENKINDNDFTLQAFNSVFDIYSKSLIDH